MLAVLEHLGLIAPNTQLDSVGKRLVALIDVGVHHVRYFNGILVLARGNHHGDRTFSVKKRITLCFGKPIAYGGDVTQANAGPIGSSEQQNVLELLTRIGLSLGPQANIAGIGAYRAAGDINGPESDYLRNLV